MDIIIQIKAKKINANPKKLSRFVPYGSKMGKISRQEIIKTYRRTKSTDGRNIKREEKERQKFI